MDAELAGKPFSLEIENELGKTTYEFDLALDDQPPSGKWFLTNFVLNIWLFFSKNCPPFNLCTKWIIVHDKETR